MVEAVMIWNEPNNMSHWNRGLDPDWNIFSRMVIAASKAIRSANPDVPIVLGGISPIDPNFIRNLGEQGVLEAVDIVSVHGFPLDWNHWNINEWPAKIAEIRAETKLPIWVSEAGASSFGAEEVQLFGMQRTAELLLPIVDRVHWYSLMDLPATWTATTRHREAEGSAYYRHYYMGLLREDGTPKLAASHFPEGLGICQWFHYRDPRLKPAVEWLRKLGVKRLRTGLSWADSFHGDGTEWFDEQMSALHEFDTTLTLCFTPEHMGIERHYASPPKRVEDFADFAGWAVSRYAGKKQNTLVETETGAEL
jgi:beta-xylosidase